MPARAGHGAEPASSTPSSRVGCSAIPGSGSARSSRRCSGRPWRRATPPPTGRPGRCPSRGCATPRSTSSCSSSCGTPWPPSSTSRASEPGRRRSSRRWCPRRRPRRGSTRGGVRPGCTGCASAASSRSSAPSGWRRDEVARQRDIAPGPRAARRGPRVRARWPSRAATEADLVALPVWGGRSLRRQTATWLPAIDDGPGAARVDLPDLKVAQDGPPPARSWPDRDPAAAARLSAARTAMAAIADEHTTAGREPPGARHGAPARLGATRRTGTRRDRGRRVPRRARCPAVAGLADRRRAGRCTRPRHPAGGGRRTRLTPHPSCHGPDPSG